MLELFGHPFSSYCWKALIALYENDTPFVFRMVDAEHPENATRLQAVSPQGKFPVLVEDERAIFEASVIIEYLQVHHPGPVQLIPREPEAGIDVRMLDRLFDNYVMTPMQAIVGNSLREEKDRSARNVADAQDMLRRSYAWLEKRLEGRAFASGDFSLADCAAAPSLFYADWVCPISQEHSLLRAYRARLLERPSISRCVEEARPYRHFFPLGAPDRD